jgi:multiple sugar transport system ATP-binding protein
MVFQSYALYPHMTVYDNMAYSLRVRGASRQEIEARVTSTAKTLDLDGLLNRRPGELSGGQRQRVALGRAIVREPRAFLFDEPLSNLDPALRGQARAELLALRTRLRATMIYVTHDQEEAMTLGTRVAVMRAGHIVQVDVPLNVYQRPANTFVATFIGSPPMNLLPASILEVDDAAGRLVGIRPQDLIVGSEGLRARVEVVEIRGPDAVVHLRLPDVDSARVVAVVTGTPPDPGAAVRLTWDPTRLLIFAPDGERCAQS